MPPSPIGVQRTGPSIRAALAEHDPEQCAAFEAEFRAALDAAAADFDLSRVQAVIDRWLPIAYARRHPLTVEERALVARFHAGDDTALWQRDGDGNWRPADGPVQPRVV